MTAVRPKTQLVKASRNVAYYHRSGSTNTHAATPLTPTLARATNNTHTFSTASSYARKTQSRFAVVLVLLPCCQKSNTCECAGSGEILHSPITVCCALCSCAKCAGVSDDGDCRSSDCIYCCLLLTAVVAFVAGVVVAAIAVCYYLSFGGGAALAPRFGRTE